MKVAIVGGESTGGRLLRRCLEAHPNLEVRHWSMPHGPREVRRFPLKEMTDYVPYAVLITVRSWMPMLASKVANHTPGIPQAAEDEARDSYETLLSWASGRRWRFVVYEALVAGLPELADVFDWLGVERIAPVEEFRDENLKWYVT